MADATDRQAKAAALYQLVLFHDNNGREAAATPRYRRAMALGLDPDTHRQAAAWLASSLFKTGQLAAAMRMAQRAMAPPCPPGLQRFLIGLQARIRRREAGEWQVRRQARRVRQ